MNDIRVRIAPSPTGFLHIGRVRTILFNYLFAKKYHGIMVFRIEDTDKLRSKKEFEDDIIEGLHWLGIGYQEGPFRQSERTNIYQRYIHELVEKGSAYEAEDSTEGGGRVIRLKNRNLKITFHDYIRGDITIDTSDLGDFIIARNINEPLYNFTVVVDDHEMKITHVIRGEDGISNTPRQILIQEAIGAQRPSYAHIPLILAKDRSKLSGRHGAISLAEYRKEGYLPETIINYLALLGWHPEGTHGKAEQEIFSLEELINLFELKRIQKGGAVMDHEKLNWFNKEYIKMLPTETLMHHAGYFVSEKHKAALSQYIDALRGRITRLDEIEKEIELMEKPPPYTGELLLWRGKLEKERTARNIDDIINLLSNIEVENFHQKEIERILEPLIQKEGRGAILWPLRAALSGRESSIGPFGLINLLGKDETKNRLEKAKKTLRE